MRTIKFDARHMTNAIRQSEQSCGVFEKHSERRRIFASVDGRPVALVALNLSELSESHRPRGSFEEHRRALAAEFGLRQVQQVSPCIA